MNRWRWAGRAAVLVFLLLFSLACYLRRGVVISDPYWGVVVNWRNWQQQAVGLLHGRWLTFRRVGEWTEAVQEMKNARASNIFLTPYWRGDLTQNTLEQDNQDVWLMTPASLPDDRAIQQVSVDQESLFREAGVEVADYLSSQQKRTHVVAYFYGGTGYDAYVKAFSEAFSSNEGLLKVHRGFTSQWTKLEDELRSLNTSRVLLVLVLGELNARALGLFEDDEKLLFVTEDNRYPGYLKSRMLLSIERDYRGLFRAALSHRKEITGYLYTPSDSPLSAQRSRWLRRDSKLWQRIVLLWN